ncbi:zinc-binding alcohol dehydrogenase family protein [Undibacterium sp. TJN19]|uniref:zinc-binding alcohol dehydrogenase family protein n=1 Tax=Undibacterium sp. TJN19 TaxID=3413055 RepID=UPI003BF0D1DF
MKAVGVYKTLPIDHVEALVDRLIPLPVTGALDLLVRVEAISVNPADYRARGRKTDDGQFAVLGWDVAGTVVGLGSNVTSGFTLGDAVYYAGDVSRPGANSEFHVVDSRIVGHRPGRLSVSEAAAIPLTALTAWEALFDRIGFSRTQANRQQSLLIVGGAGGAGSMAIQLARLLPGVRVIATASRLESQAWCRELGADAVIDHFADMRAQLENLGLPQVDAILLLNDPDRHFPALADVLAPQGTICSIVPFKAAPDINLLMRKSASFVWEFMSTRPMYATADMSRQRDILNIITGLIEAGQIKSAASRDLGTINAENLRIAHSLLESGRTIGKLTLTGF